MNLAGIASKRHDDGFDEEIKISSGKLIWEKQQIYTSFYQYINFTAVSKVSVLGLNCCPLRAGNDEFSL